MSDLPTICRTLIPGYDPWKTAGDCWFEAEAAQTAVAFFPAALRHVEGAMAGQPFRLELWQQAIIGNLFGWKRKDAKGRTVRRYRECLLYVPRKNGKALAIDTPIPTPHGWVAMGDLKPGDTVFDECGYPCQVIETHPIMFGNRCYRVTFSDKTSIVADAEHLWTTRTRKPEDGIGVYTTEQIAETLTAGNRDSHRERNHAIPVCEPLETPETYLPVHPYVIGVWLGDGDSDSARLTYCAADSQIVSELESCGCSVGVPRKDSRSSALRARIGGHGGKPDRTKDCLNKRLRKLGVLNNKHIPPLYLRASASQRIALLQGLMDTDGYASKAGQCEFTTTRRPLLDGIVELLRSLGMKPTIVTARAMMGGKDCGNKFRVQFWAVPGIQPFRLRRKRERVKIVTAGRSRTRQIISVEPVASVPVRCIRVGSSSQLFLAGEGMVPTHNTPLIAGLAAYVLFCENERGQQNYVAASDREQAGLLFRHLKGMVLQSPQLKEACEIYGGTAPSGQSRSIVRKFDQSFVRVISADAERQHGGLPHLIIMDELHTQPDAELYDVLHTGMASENRAQPLFVSLTTADFERPSVCNERHDYACQVRDGLIDDPTFLPVVYETLRDADWTAESTWRVCNPNLDISVSLEYLRGECEKAKTIPRLENTFKRLHLNMRTESDERWLNLASWDAGDAAFSKAELLGEPCWCGLDLSTTTDLSAFAAVFQRDGKRRAVVKFWVPAATVREKSHKDRVSYETWINAGWIDATPGDTIDYDRIRAFVNDFGQSHRIEEIACDRWNATQIIKQLDDDGFCIFEFGQGYQSMSPAAKELERCVLSGEMALNRNPVMRWMAGNVMVETDAAGNIKPSKKKSTQRIDGIVALTMANHRAALAETGSIFETRGLRTL